MNYMYISAVNIPVESVIQIDYILKPTFFNKKKNKENLIKVENRVSKSK